MSVQKNYPYFGVPPTKPPRPAASVGTLRGKRVILSTPEGFVYDMRAVSECHLGAGDSAVVDILSEEDYFRWMLTGKRKSPEHWSAHLVWVE